MRQKNLLLLGLFAVPLMQPLGTPNGVNSQDIMPATAQSPGRDSTEAPTGFDNLTNGLTDQAVFEADRRVFEESETIEHYEPDLTLIGLRLVFERNTGAAANEPHP